MRSLLFLAAPIVLVTGYALARALLGRPLSRRSLDVLGAILLLAYFAATASLGIFWVANQDLPPLGLHYLFGYFTLLLVLCHVGSHFRQLVAFFRRALPGEPRAPAPAVPGGFRGAAIRALLLVALSGTAFYLGLRWGKERIVLVPVPVRSAAPLRAETGEPAAAGGQSRQAEPAGGAPDRVAAGSEAPPAPEPPRAAELPPAEGPSRARGFPDGVHRYGIEEVLLYHERSSHSLIRALRRSPSVYWGSLPVPYKSYPGAGVIPLPEPRAPHPAGVTESLAAGPPAAAAPGHPPTLQELSCLLHFTGGITEKRIGIELRASASAGALYPMEVYVLVREVPGLAPGLYHYAVRGHALHRLQEGDLGEALSGAVADPGIGSSPLTFLLTAVVSRSASKYGDRSYRYALMDAGHAARNLLAVARALGRPARLAGTFDDARVNALLGVDGIQEFALLIAALDPAAQEPPGPAPPPASDAWEPVPVTEAPVSRTGSVALVHTVTSLHLGEAAGTPASPRERAPAEPARVPNAILLPFPPPSAADIFEAIAERRSRRRFREVPIASADLSGILSDAARPVLAAAGPSLSTEGNLALEAWVVVHAAEGIAPGIYRFDPGGHALLPARSGVSRQASYRAAVSQDVVRDSAVWLVLAADTERVFEAHGPRGYRYALLDAGLVGEGVYLDGEARGLGVCSVGAFYDPEIHELLGLDAERHMVLLTVAIGVL